VHECCRRLETWWLTENTVECGETTSPAMYGTQTSKQGEGVNVLEYAGSLTNSSRVLKYGTAWSSVATLLNRRWFMLVIQGKKSQLRRVTEKRRNVMEQIKKRQRHLLRNSRVSTMLRSAYVSNQSPNFSKSCGSPFMFAPKFEAL
jgi:hypothetical protein